MAVDQISSTSGYTNLSSTQAGQGILGKDDFLRIFIEQLKNQDPLEPLKDREFISQMAQFSSLEQISNLNSSTEQLVEMQSIMVQELMGIKDSMNGSLFGNYSELIDKTGYWTNQEGLEMSGRIDSIILKNQQYLALINGHEVLISDLYKVETGLDVNGSNL